MKKPTILYRYNDRHELEKHKVKFSCNPQATEYFSHGQLYRCRYTNYSASDCIRDAHDCYGYPERRSAEIEEMRNLARSIGQLTVKKELLVKKLQREAMKAGNNGS